MNKKAQGISVNVIIVAAIALIVLVVLIAIFTGQMAEFINKFKGAGDAAKTCQEQSTDEHITQLKAACDEDTEVEIASSNAAASGQKCCRQK